ncbi:MAG: MotA/TolQ/ExbB proton channel family protein [Lachnospiraceae bacterium]|nr:MotA/TolQ/ExbB proton channel family protein [Lachnospiraceae bacterium]
MLSVISNLITPVIIVLTVLMLFVILKNFTSLKEHYHTISHALNGVEVKKEVDPFGNVTEYERRTAADIDTIHSYENKYNESRSAFETISQLIPIFPLMGILGTVAGIMGQTTAKDSYAIVGSLNIALYSTFWGLIASIGLKLLITLLNGRIINSIDNMLESYDTTIRTRGILNRIKEEQ